MPQDAGMGPCVSCHPIPQRITTVGDWYSPRGSRVIYVIPARERKCDSIGVAANDVEEV